MSCSLLFEINNDISSIIDVYVKTFKNRKRMKEELNNKIRQSLVKKFNMEINNVTLDNYLNNTEGYLYWIPKSPGWIWLGKRFLFDNPNVNHDFRKIIVKTGINKGYCCSCMKKCRWINCPNNGNHMDVIRFPKNILDLHKMGYYDLRVLLSEIK